MGFQQKRGRLGLHRFAEAKSSNYNFLRLNKKQRERQQNAKRVNKYRRLLAKEGHQHRQEPGSPQGVKEQAGVDAERAGIQGEHGDDGAPLESTDGPDGAEPRARVTGNKHTLKKASHPEGSSHRETPRVGSSERVIPEAAAKKGLLVGRGIGKGIGVEGSSNAEAAAGGSSGGVIEVRGSKTAPNVGKRKDKPSGVKPVELGKKRGKLEVDPVAAEDEASRLREIEAKRRMREEAIKRRKMEAKSMRKTNAKGQPLMRHRIDRILDALTKPKR